MSDADAAPLDPRLRPILAYVKKLTLTPTRVTGKDAAAVYAAGWDERALFDSISIRALFNFMNRIVEGSGLRSNPLTAPDEIRRDMVQSFSNGYRGSDPHQAPKTYTRLLALWGVPDIPDRSE